MRNWLFLVSGLDPRQGGIQVSALELIEALEPSHTRYIVYGSDPQNACANSKAVVCEASQLKLVAKTCLHRWPADVAVCWHMSMLKLLPFARGFHGKVVVFLHGVEAWRQHSPAMLKKLNRVDLFLSNSDYTWQRFLEFAPELAGHRHLTTPLGFGAPTPPVPAPTEPMALMIGRMMQAEDYKGHRELITAWPEVLKLMPEAKLEIIGEGDLKPVLEKLVASLSLQPNIHFHGRVDEQTKQRLLQSCRVMALPSRAEGFGIVYLEAMRYGRPCLVSDCDAGREVIHPPEAGLAVDPGHREALVNSLLLLMAGDSRWHTWSEQARERYERQYTVESYQRRLVTIIDDVCGG